MTIRGYDVSYLPIPKGVHSKFKKRRGKVVRRDPSVVDGVTLHQTAIHFGPTAADLANAEGDRDIALAYRVKRIASHATSFDGFYAKTYPLDYYIYHGNYLNKKTLGLEVEGLYPGLIDDPTTLWKGQPTELTEGRIEAAREALCYLVEEGKALGMPIKYIYAHRQAKKNRRSDPGEELWRKVALEYGVDVLGLKTRPMYALATGRPIPRAWDPQGIGDY